ncbi:translation machinery associated tma7 protein [Toxoplasma gondii GAB2-2007-GAL-DOM2]|uniref:Translation machinery associated tma7 protein n=1 Tax=Toxoplasma gondii GAB2-2007-GAL-DOM2 TaxID=1130820 RepID=A0A086KP07_TOXGO|nr:translation machinery associated tma7 protein [Toxoplasma gondii GAB2-2007-GAL-DOM2]
MTFVLTAGEKDYADARVTISVELRLLSSGKGFIRFLRGMSPARGGKRKPLKQPKKASCEDETDMEFKKKQSQQAREEEAARKALLAKSAAKKK